MFFADRKQVLEEATKGGRGGLAGSLLAFVGRIATRRAEALLVASAETLAIATAGRDDNFLAGDLQQLREHGIDVVVAVNSEGVV